MKFDIDTNYLKQTLKELLMLPSPTGLTDEIVHYVATRLENMSVPYELTRRGTIRSRVKGVQKSPDRAVVAHLDTIGAMVCLLKNNGRLGLLPIGTWSSRFAEGVRVTIYSDKKVFRGTVMPLLASGHAFNQEVDTQPVEWGHVELRLDEPCANQQDLEKLGINIGDIVAFDANPEFINNGFIVSRHLDNKAGVACLLTAIKMLKDKNITLPIDCHPIFSLTEEIGTGAAEVVEHDVSEMLSIDIAPSAVGQNSDEEHVTIAMMDSSGPYDYHLTRHLIELAKANNIKHRRDVFKFYHSDSASAIAAGRDLRTSLICFGGDASHGYERTHISGLIEVTKLLMAYMTSDPTYQNDGQKTREVKDFPHQIKPGDIHVSGDELPNPRDYLG